MDYISIIVTRQQVVAEAILAVASILRSRANIDINPREYEILIQNGRLLQAVRSNDFFPFDYVGIGNNQIVLAKIKKY